jgi:hypothetical protein
MLHYHIGNPSAIEIDKNSIASRPAYSVNPWLNSAASA